MTSRGWPLTAAAGLLLVGSLVAGAFALPSSVAVYFGPGSAPDAEQPRLLFLLIAAAAAVGLAFAVALVAVPLGRVVAAFAETPPAGRATARLVPDVAASCVLATVVAGVWVAILLGNEDHELRSTVELVVGGVGVLLTIVAVLVAAFAPRRGRG